jgi:predicted amidophosphoribosyltransferase
MKLQSPSRTLPDGGIEPAHAIEVFCGACGYDLDQAELEADTCSDCGQPLSLARNVAIEITTVPAASGVTM